LAEVITKPDDLAIRERPDRAPLNAAIYLRVSSKDGRQDEANQEPECAERAALEDAGPRKTKQRRLLDAR